MNRKKQKLVAALLLLTLLTVSVPALAGDIDELRKQQSQLNSQIENLKKSIKQLDTEKKNVAEEIVELEQKLSQAEKELAATEAKLKDTQAKLETTKKEWRLAEERVEEQTDDLNKRMRTMYKMGPVDYIEVILGASSFSDFLTRLDMVERIIEADRALLAEFKARKEEVAQKKSELEEQQKLIEAQRNMISEKRAQIVAYRGDRQRLMARLEEEKREYERQQDQLEKDAENLRRQILAWEMQNKKGYFGTGVFRWPVPSSTYVTSEFGWRIHPIYKTRRFHDGIDIAASMGADVLAADDGEVIFAGSYGGYGYTIILSHGGGISTQYSHLSKILVSVGKQVLKGDKIGLVGSTGLSTGPHLHFTVIKDGQAVSPWNWLK